MSQNADLMLANFSLPVMTEQPLQQISPPVSRLLTPEVKPSVSVKVLVAETDRTSRLSRTRLLKQEGYSVTGAATIEEAAKMAERESYDLLVIEVEEPELLNMLLAQFPADMSVLLIASGDIAARAAECSGAGIHSFLIEPFTAVRFKSAVLQTIDRARLVKESLRNQVLTSLEQANHKLAVENEVGNFFRLIVEIGANSTGADCVSLSTLDEMTGKTEVQVRLGEFKPDWEQLSDRLMEIHEPLLLTGETQSHSSVLEMMPRAGISSILHVPLTVRGELVGVLTHIRAAGRKDFTSGDLSLASILGWWCSMVLENTRLYSSFQKQYHFVGKLLDKISFAQENERKRVAIDIHDGVAQWLVGASYDVRICSKLVSESRYDAVESLLEKIRQILQKSVKELRRAIANLPLPPLEEIGLVGTIYKAAEILNEDGISCNIEVSEELPELTMAQKKICYMIVQESLTNIRRHSHASECNLLIKHVDNTLSINIKDNGEGFDPGRALNSSISIEHMGLLGMKERARLLGGNLEIESKPGKGTSISFSCALSAKVVTRARS